MSDDPASGDGVPEPVREWLAGVAEESEVSEQELLAGLLAGDGGGLGTAGGVDAAGLADRVDELEAAVADLDDELDEKIDDVRDRVIQVKREADAKAPAEHDHAEVAGAVDRLDEQLDALGRDFVDVDAAVDGLDERVGAVDARLDEGFSNFEAVLEYVIERADRLDEKVATLARATTALRERADRLAAAEAERAAADRLRSSAHEHGVTAADCESCGRTVHLGLLAGPECPHCAARFTEVEPRRGFFRSSVLHTGERPALEGDVGREQPDLGPLVEGEAPTAPPVDPGSSGAGATGQDAAREPTPGDDEPLGSAGNPAADRDLDAVSGIGPAYAEQLRGAGVETVGALALADPGRLADETDIAPGRLRTLVARARELVESGTESSPGSSSAPE